MSQLLETALCNFIECTSYCG